MTAGPVSAALAAKVGQQLDEYGVVVWYDPERIYGELATSERFPGTLVVVVEDSLLAARRALEPALAGDQPGRALVYVPRSREACDHALIEAEAAGAVMRPGEQPPARNTRLAVVARQALAVQLAGETLESVVREVERGRLTLAELDGMGSEAPDLAVLGVVFGTGDAEKVALRLLTEPDLDKAVVARGALEDLAALMGRAFGTAEGGAGDPTVLRRGLVRAVLLSDVAEGLGAEGEAALAKLPLPGGAQSRARGAALAREWRNRRDLQASYVELAGAVDELLAGVMPGLSLEQLAGIEATCGADRALQRKVVEAAAASPTQELLGLAVCRQDGFWAGAVPEALDRWSLIAAVLRLLLEAEEVGGEVAQAGEDVGELSRAYLEGVGEGAPWCRLDSSFRHMERRVRTSEAMLAEEAADLQRLVAAARRRYREVIEELASRFVPALHGAGYAAPGVVRQREVHDRWVRPAVERGRTAWVLVDGLRYEMGRELAAGLGESLAAELHAALAQAPTVTVVGMGALMPYAHQGMELSARSGRLQVEINGRRLASRADRMAYLAEVHGSEAAAFHLPDLLPPAPRTRKALKGARLAVVTATDELDGLGERMNAAMAHRLMDDVLQQLRRAFRVLAGHGFETIVVAADHGFLLGAETGEAAAMTRPGGETAALLPGAWVGRGGAQGPGFVRATAADVGLGGELELAFPLALGCFGAAGAYHHGGVTPQEAFVPVLVIRPGAAPVSAAGFVSWAVTLGTRTLSSPFLTVHVEGRVEGLFEVAPPRVRVEVREGRAVISTPVSAAYGFDEGTGDVVMEAVANGQAMRKNSILVRLNPLPAARQVDVVVVDAESGAEMAAMAGVPVTLAGF